MESTIRLLGYYNSHTPCVVETTNLKTSLNTRQQEYVAKTVQDYYNFQQVYANWNQLLVGWASVLENNNNTKPTQFQVIVEFFFT